jgi:hypothetical protein
MSKDNPNIWNGDGKPAVVTIEEILGRDVTAGQRDEAWAAMQ